MADIDFTPPTPKTSEDIDFTPPASKGGYFSGDQGLVPDVIENVADVATDVGKGIVAGAISIPQGIVELAAIAIDSQLDTDTASAVTDAFEIVKPEVNGLAGEITQDLVAFGAGFIPVAGWLGRAGQAAKLAKTGKKMSTAGRGKFAKSAIDFGSSKAGQMLVGSKKGMIASTAVGALGYSTIVANDGRTTLSDNFEIMPDFLETEEDAGFTGTQEASRRWRNKLRQGVEDMALSGVVDTGLTLFGAGSRAIGRTKTGNALAKGALKVPGKVSTGMAKGFEAAGLDVVNKTAGKLKAKLVEGFTASGGADEVLYEITQDSRAVADMSERLGVMASKDFVKAERKFLKASKLGKKGQTPVDAQRVKSGLFQFLTGNRAPLEAFASDDMIKAADQMIVVRSNLEEDLMRQLRTEIGEDPATGKLLTPDTPAKLKAQEALEEILLNQKQQNGYLRRQFQMYINPVNFYKSLDLSSKGFDDAVEEVAQNQARMAFGPLSVVSDAGRAVAKNTVLETLGLKTVMGQTADEVLKDVIASQKRIASGGLLGMKRSAEKPVLRTVEDIFIARAPIIDQSPSLQKLMGVLTDPIEVYKKTINDMAQANAAADMYRTLRFDGMAVDAKTALESLRNGGRPSIVEIPDRLKMTDGEYDRAMAPFQQEAVDNGVKMQTSPDGFSVLSPAEVVLKGYVDALASTKGGKGYVRLGDETAETTNHLFGGQYGAMTGSLVSPESFSALTASTKFGGNTFIGEALGALSQARSLSQKMQIVPNPGAQVRNLAGNGLMLAANANLGRHTDFADMFKLFATSLSDLDELGLTRLAKKISMSGTMDTSLVTRALKEFAKAGEDLVGVGPKLAKAIDFYQDKIPFMQLFEQVYGESDSFFKGLAVLGEEEKILHAFKAAGLNDADPDMFEALVEGGLAKRLSSRATEFGDGQSLSALEVMAADAVKDTMPIYPRIGKFVRALDVFPLIGNFTSFASENIRNSANILQRGLREMAFTVPPKQRLKFGEAKSSAFELQMRAIGSQRLASFATVATIGPSMAVKASLAATNTTPEEYEAFNRTLPDFMRGHQTIMLKNYQNGKYDYIDTSYVSPYAFVIDPIRAALQVYGQKGQLNKSEVEKIASGAWKGLEMFVSPFAEESLLQERLVDVIPTGFSGGLGRSGKTKEGFSIYGSEDNLGTQMDKSFGHIMNGILPNYVTLIGELDEPISGLASLPEKGVKVAAREAFNQGRVMRSMTGTVGKRGEEYNAFKEAARLVTGFTPMTVDLPNDFKYSGLEYTPKRNAARSMATSAMKQANLTKDDMLREWDTYLDNLYRVQSELYQDVQNARAMNLSETAIRRNLTQGAKLGSAEAGAIMDGEFWPRPATTEMWAGLQILRNQEGRRFEADMSDFSPFQRRVYDRVREPLAGTPPPRSPNLIELEQDIDFNAPAPMQDIDFTPPAPMQDIDFTPPAPDQQGALSPPPQPTQTAAAKINPALLGGDPATQNLAKALGRSL